mgnify:FL=1
MGKKNILIVSGSFYPEISPRAFRTSELALELSRQGHDVTVYIPFYKIHYTLYAKEYCLTIKDLGPLKWRDVELRGGKVELIIRRTVKRVLKMLFEWPDIELTFKVYKALRTLTGFDLLISIAVPYPIHWGVARVLSVNNGLTELWVADCGDPYMGDTTDSFRKLFYFKYIEKWFCRNADFITVPFAGAISAYYPEFIRKIRIIPQGYRLDNLNLPVFRKQHEYPVFAYAGSFIQGKRDPGQLLGFLSGLNIEFRFVIFTSQDKILADAKKKLGDKLEIRPLIPRIVLLSELSRMDFLINFDNSVSTQLPSKLIDYAITGRPVLTIFNNDDFSLLTQFLAGDYSNRMILEAPDTYDIKNIAGQFVNLHNEV